MAYRGQNTSALDSWSLLILSEVWAPRGTSARIQVVGCVVVLWLGDELLLQYGIHADIFRLLQFPV